MKFDSRDHGEFFDELREEGYHIYARAKARKDFYPNTFPAYPTVSYSDLREGDTITIRAEPLATSRWAICTG